MKRKELFCIFFYTHDCCLPFLFFFFFFFLVVLVVYSYISSSFINKVTISIVLFVSKNRIFTFQLKLMPFFSFNIFQYEIIISFVFFFPNRHIFLIKWFLLLNEKVSSNFYFHTYVEIKFDLDQIWYGVRREPKAKWKIIGIIFLQNNMHLWLVHLLCHKSSASECPFAWI